MLDDFTVTFGSGVGLLTNAEETLCQKKDVDLDV